MGERETDQLLVERVQKGDKRAFDLLVGKYQHKIVSLISRYVSDHAGRWTLPRKLLSKPTGRSVDFVATAPFTPGCIESRSIRPRITSFRKAGAPPLRTWMHRMRNNFRSKRV